MHRVLRLSIAIAAAGLFAGAAPAQKAPPPAAAAPVAGVTTPEPIGDPGKWIPLEAYPPEARAAGQQGRTEFALKIDPRGRIMQCDIVRTSGSDLLDTTTCSLLISNGSFKPARDAAGKPVVGVWQSAMRWQLVESPAPEE